MKEIINSSWSWILQPFVWSEWKDIITFTYGSSCYLLQGKVNKISNAKKFRITNFKQFFSHVETPKISLTELKEKGL